LQVRRLLLYSSTKQHAIQWMNKTKLEQPVSIYL
jgi:hypothetical protein